MEVDRDIEVDDEPRARKNGPNGGRRKKSTRGGGSPPRSRNGGGRDHELEELLEGLRSLEVGDFEVRLQPNGDDLVNDIVEAFNRVALRSENLSKEVMRVSNAVGREGMATERAFIGEVDGSWATTVNSMNALITDLMQPTTEVARVIEAVARGDLSQKMVLEIEGKTVQGEIGRAHV